MNYFKILRPFLFTLNAETAHNLAIKALKYDLVPSSKIKHYSTLKNEVLGINFDNPIGMAAGFDKNAEVFSRLFNFGFGFVECGTVTPKAQAGNPKPRLFRLAEDKAIINRLGFNNKGIENYLRNVAKHKNHQQILGLNIGKNKDTVNAIDDYALLLDKVYQLSSYITINISSPNTKNLRDLQKKDELELFLAAIAQKKKDLVKKYGKSVPILLKIAPDLNDVEQQAIAKITLKHKIDGLIISNTTIANRELLTSKYKGETGGLSGAPLLKDSTKVLKNIYKLTKGAIPIIGVGGIASAEDAYQKIKAGASLVQIYSSFIYEGFGLVEIIKKDLDALLQRDGFKNVSEAIGVDAK